MSEPISFTAQNLLDLPVADKAYELREAGRTALRVRVGTTGVLSFRWVCTARGKGYTLGAFDPADCKSPRERKAALEQALVDARAKLALYKKRHEADVDPEGSSVSEGERPKTVAQLADLFYAQEILGRCKRPEAVLDVLKRDIKETIGATHLDVLDTVIAGAPARAAVARGAKVHAGKVITFTKQLFAFGANNGYLKVSPAASLTRRSAGAKPHKKGKRYLRAEELAAFWRALDRSRMDPATRYALRLLMLTGLRMNMLRLSTWDDVDLEKKKTLVIRAERRKMTPEQSEEAGDWTLPLSEPALECLRGLRVICPKGVDWVFASPRSKSGVLDDHTMGRAMKRLWESDAGLSKLLAELKTKAVADPDLRDIKTKPLASPHDFRRTIETHMTQTLKEDFIIARLTTDHSINKLLDSATADTYNRDTKLDERRAALDRYAAWVVGLVDGGGEDATVIPLKSAK